MRRCLLALNTCALALAAGYLSAGCMLETPEPAPDPQPGDGIAHCVTADGRAGEWTCPDGPISAPHACTCDPL